MKAKRFKTHKPGRGGWTEWIYPESKSYLMKCCDCGLVHELQFKTFAETKQKRDKFEVAELPWPIRAMFRARRASRLMKRATDAKDRVSSWTQAKRDYAERVNNQTQQRSQGEGK